MYQIHPDLLWLGHAFDVRNPQPLFENKIKAVVDVAYEEPPAQLPRQLIYCRFPLNDGGGNHPTVLLQAVQTLVDLLASGTPTLVACSAGMSRSPTVVAFGLAAHLSRDSKDILGEIANLKALEINPALWRDFEAVYSKIKFG